MSELSAEAAAEESCLPALHYAGRSTASAVAHPCSGSMCLVKAEVHGALLCGGSGMHLQAAAATR